MPFYSGIFSENGLTPHGFLIFLVSRARARETKKTQPSGKHFADSCRQAILLSYSRTPRGCWVPRSRKREHGLAPLSPCGPSLILGVELLLDAFFAHPG